MLTAPLVESTQVLYQRFGPCLQHLQLCQHQVLYPRFGPCLNTFSCVNTSFIPKVWTMLAAPLVESTQVLYLRFGPCLQHLQLCQHKFYSRGLDHACSTFSCVNTSFIPEV